MPNRYAQKVEALKGKFIDYNQGLQPVHVSDEQMQKIEGELNASLPEDYTEFIRDYGDYGFFYGTTFPVEPNAHRIESGGLEEVYGAVPGWQNSENGLVGIYRSFCGHMNKWPHNWLPIGAAGRDDRIALSIAGEDKGAVYLIVEHLWETGEGAFRVASSFDEFIQSLYNVDEEDE
jgi:hypothetical protein